MTDRRSFPAINTESGRQTLCAKIMRRDARPSSDQHFLFVGLLRWLTSALYSRSSNAFCPIHSPLATSHTSPFRRRIRRREVNRIWIRLARKRSRLPIAAATCSPDRKDAVHAVGGPSRPDCPFWTNEMYPRAQISRCRVSVDHRLPAQLLIRS